MLLFCFCGSLFADQVKIQEEFNKQLVKNNLVFNLPVDFIPVKFDSENCNDVCYSYAIKHINSKVEIRYSIFHLDEVIKEGDDLHVSFMLTVVENIAGNDKVLKFTKFDKKNKSDKKFNADFGASILVNPKSEFGKGYKYAMIIALFKNDSRNVYITYLFDDMSELKSAFDQSLYSLKFKS